MADGAMGWSGAAREERKRRNIKICVAHVKHIYQKGGSATAIKSLGRKSGVRQTLGFTQKNFASHLEYSIVVPGCHSLALAALCMDMVLETQDLG